MSRKRNYQDGYEISKNIIELMVKGKVKALLMNESWNSSSASRKGTLTKNFGVQLKSWTPNLVNSLKKLFPLIMVSDDVLKVIEDKDPMIVNQVVEKALKKAFK